MRDHIDAAIQHAFEEWVSLLDEQGRLYEAGLEVFTEEEMKAQRAVIFKMPPKLNTGFASVFLWGWKVYRFNYPVLSVAGLVCCAFWVLNLAASLLHG